MAFFQPPRSGWTAMSIVPNPDLHAQGNVSLDRISSTMQTMPASNGNVGILPAPSQGYGQIFQSMFGNPPVSAVQPLVQRQQQAQQAIQPQSILPSMTGGVTPQQNKQEAAAQKKANQSGWVPPFAPQV